jgi:hypothetical protein
VCVLALVILVVVLVEEEYSIVGVGHCRQYGIRGGNYDIFFNCTILFHTFFWAVFKQNSHSDIIMVKLIGSEACRAPSLGVRVLEYRYRLGTMDDIIILLLDHTN